MMNGYGFGGMGIIGPVIQIGIVVLVIYLVFSLIKRPEKDNNDGQKTDAIGILNHRYALGELTDEEYERMKQTLQS